MGLIAEQNQQEQYNCEQCNLKFRNNAGLANHRKFSSMHAHTTVEQPEPSSTIHDHEEPEAKPALPDSTTEASPDPSLDELIWAEWNDEFFQKHFPALHAAGIRYIPNTSEIPEDFWISLMTSDFSQNDHESVVESSTVLPASITCVDDNPSTTH
ncbi:hypothetical protein DFS33DRAFT_243554 [Desarmillaria ectypa]|nr:hypothetical protein DFS33DRAFT_243554 [Desarmillaria ectypa]